MTYCTLEDVKPRVGVPQEDSTYDQELSQTILEAQAIVDTGAGRTLIPEGDAIELGLPYVGDAPVITGSGKDTIKVFMATITFLGREFYIPIYGRDVPEQAVIKAVVGRDILDNFKICFNGRAKEIEIQQ